MAKKDDVVKVPDASNSGITLLGYIEQIESLEIEKKSLASDQKEIKGAIKSMGFDTNIVNEILKRRRVNRDDQAEKEAMIETYERTLEEAAENRRVSDAESATKAKLAKL